MNINEANPLKGHNGEYYGRTIQSLTELADRINTVLQLMNSHTLETLPPTGVGEVVSVVLGGHDLLCKMAQCYDQEIGRQLQAAEIENPEVVDVSRDVDFEKFMKELLGGDYPVQ